MSRPRFQERHQDYALASIATLAAGQVMTGIPLQLDMDAPFVLRSRAAISTSIQGGLGSSYYDLRFLQMSFTGPDDQYVSQSRVLFGLEAPYFGCLGNPCPVYPQLIYPAGGVIYVDVENAGTFTINNLRIVFRGVKLFPWGVLPSLTYPKNPRKILPYSYPLTISGLGISETRPNVPFIVNPDGDFVLRAAQSGMYRWDLAHEVSVLLRDSQGKGFSNLPVHVDVLFGASSMFGGSGEPFGRNFTAGRITTGVAAWMTGPSNPGLFYPEIYVPRNTCLYLDVVRNDSAESVTQAPVDYRILLTGAKVIP